MNWKLALPRLLNTEDILCWNFTSALEAIRTMWKFQLFVERYFSPRSGICAEKDLNLKSCANFLAVTNLHLLKVREWVPDSGITSLRHLANRVLWRSSVSLASENLSRISTNWFWPNHKRDRQGLWSTLVCIWMVMFQHLVIPFIKYCGNSSQSVCKRGLITWLRGDSLATGAEI